MYKVIKEFRDINNLKKVYKVGDEFISDDKKRINNLIERGLIEGEENSPSYDSMTKKEIKKLLDKKEIDYNSRQTKDELIELLEG